MKEGICIPNVTFKTRVGDEKPNGGGCPIGGEWKDVTTREIFEGNTVVVFSLPEHSHQHVLHTKYLFLMNHMTK